MKSSVRCQASSDASLELLLLAIEEAVRRALELDQLVLLAHRAERLLELEVVLVADGLVRPALEGQDRRLDVRDEVDHPARPAVEADDAGEAVAPRPPPPTSRYRRSRSRG